MSEWCLDCWNNDRDQDERELTIDVVTLSTDLHLCEGCGEYKKVIVEVKE